MADVKKTNTAKNNNHKNYHKPNKNYDKKNYEEKKQHVEKDVKTEAVKVKEVKIVSKDETEEEEDKKLIMIIAIAILVIIATIIGLLVGCQKEEASEPEQKQEDVVIEEKDDTEEEEEETVAKKTTTKTTKKVTKVSTEEEVEEEKDKFNIVYNYARKEFVSDVESTPEYEYLIHHEKVEEGSVITEYVPKGYTTCKYYTDEAMTSEYDFTKEVSENVTLYLDCETISYKVNYVFDKEIASNVRASELEEEIINPETFNGNDEINLHNLETNYVFLGWYLDYDEETDTYSNKVEQLSRKLYAYADENNTITLYAKLRESITVKYLTKDETQSTEVVITDNDTHRVEGNLFQLEGFLGWTLDKESTKLVSTNDIISDDMTLYAVCGDAVVTYEYNQELVNVGYTDEELLDEEFVLPTPSDLGIEPTTYVVLVDEETETSKTVVSDDDVEINLEKQMTLTEATNKAIEGYEPQLGDNVEEMEEEFTGWRESTGEFDPETDKMILEEEQTTTEEIVEELTESTEEPASEYLVGESEVPAENTPIVEG